MNASGRLGILVVTYQSERHIGPLFQSLAATIDRDRTVIWVYDNASTDATVAAFERENLALRLNARLVRGKTNLGFSQANNETFTIMRKETPCDIICLLNPDTVVHEGWWQPLVAALENPKVGTAVSLLLMPDGAVNARGNGAHFLGMGFVQGFGENASSVQSMEKSSFFGSGAALAFRTATIESMNAQLGLSDIFWGELFSYAEDTDLGWRMRLVGLDNRLVPSSLITHDYRFWMQEPGASSERMFWIERNRYLLLLCNFRWATLVIMLPWIVASEIALSLGLWKLYPHRLLLWRAIGKEMQSPQFWSRRRGIQSGRTARDHDILRAMTGSIRHGGRAFGIFDRILDGALRCSHKLLCLVVRW